MAFPRHLLLLLLPSFSTSSYPSPITTVVSPPFPRSAAPSQPSTPATSTKAHPPPILLPFPYPNPFPVPLSVLLAPTLSVELSSLDAASHIDVFANRLCIWHSYAPLIASLLCDGFFTPFPSRKSPASPAPSRTASSLPLRSTTPSSSPVPPLNSPPPSTPSPPPSLSTRLGRLTRCDVWLPQSTLLEMGSTREGRPMWPEQSRIFSGGRKRRGFQWEHREGTEQRAAAFAHALEAVITEERTEGENGKRN